MRLLNLLNENILNEVSQKVKDQLYSKWSSDTSDSPEVIMSYIDSFDKYQNGLPSDKRDITKYSYSDLKSLIDSKQHEKNLKIAFNGFKKRESGIENNQLKKYLKKFFEIQSELPNKLKDVNDLKFSDVVKLIDKVYDKLLTEKMVKKFSSENKDLSNDIITYYILAYTTNYDLIPFETKGIDKMSFSELEGILDSLEGKKDITDKKKNDFSDIDLRYDQNNLKIFAPKDKSQCIRLKNGRGWCTSREGSGNMYYNYRLGHERTLYYVIDEDKDFNDVDFASVILVDPDGRMALADKTNSGRYAGSTNLPWDEIVSKIPKIEDLKHIFKPEPLTRDEKELINLVKYANVGDNPMESFENPQQVEMWLEYHSKQLTDIQYSNLTPDLKKKYIALGMSLSPKMITSSEPEVISYYMSKKIDKLRESSLNGLLADEVALLNIPAFKKLKEELKPKFAKELTIGDEKLRIDSFSQGAVGKFITLYGLDDLFESLPTTLNELQIYNKDNSDVIINIPESISRFKELNMIFLDNCIESIPDSICTLSNLRFLALTNNQKLTSIPDCISDLPNMYILNLKGSPNVMVPKKIQETGTDMGGGMWDLE